MAGSDREAIETFMSITGASEADAVQILEEHGGNLNAAVNAHFSEGDRSASANVHQTSVAAQDDFMDIDDPALVAPRGPLLPLLSAAREMMNPFSVLDSSLPRGLFRGTSLFPSDSPYVTHPREVRQIPIEVKDGSQPSGQSGHAPVIEDVTETAHAYGSEIHGTVITEDEDDESNPVSSAAQPTLLEDHKDSVSVGSSRERHVMPSAPVYDQSHENYDIEEEMIQAAIEASKREAKSISDPTPQQPASLEDSELANAVSLSMQTAEQEKALREQQKSVGEPMVGASQSAEVAMRKVAPLNGRLEQGSSSFQDAPEDLEEKPLVRHRTRRRSSGYEDRTNEIGDDRESPPSSPRQHHTANNPQHNGNSFPDEWGGISSEEHDEAVMLEAAMFGGIPEGTGYHFPYTPHQFMRGDGLYPRPAPRPPSPSLAAQRLIREQQDDEYLASLQADREKELKAMEEAEARRVEEKQKEEEARRKLEEQQELERQLAAKEASLPAEPAADDENAVTLLVRMPDGSRRGRRFLKSNSLQSLFDFIDIAGAVKPGSYRLVRPYPRRTFGDGERAMTLNELGLTNKQEALFLELV